ncbi:Thiolase-like protein [Glarea lozoyensis ATCC 20868]|uniref:Thiolase-like protein n=1 Tax=Glarea lozoyensis (strain ATCC 20868 / MF5171) TaxID=1116229 RepID=S3DEN3_GLAL2|nr:Thiolase-like protein [Glarea lozoyensis ATCC 20868]EPE35574.1 Thiolase-like protein [Glarea lozoyensis ATCC 20868]
MSSKERNTSGDAVAIIGLSCRFPGKATNPSKFWDLLKEGRHGFSTSTDRYNAEAFQHPVGNGKRQNVIPTKGGYFLEQDPYVFDAAFFNITAAEAMALDPRQRIAMEVAYEAFENAGMPLQKVAGSQTACYMGASMSDYRDGVARDFANFPKYHILGVSDEMISNRISHFLDIHGPSATIQTACSSSLVATHLACQSLRSGESEMALAGGVGLILSTDGTMHLSNLGFLNPTGHSRSFDKDAGGYGRGEGCGVLVLKMLDNAVRDGDNIRAVIRGSGVNSDGWTQGVTMPSLEAQANLIDYVYKSNGLDYTSIQYVDCHGTGTKVGDPIEAEAIHRTIGQKMSSSRKKLYVGSVKPNIGHLEAAAGVASIIKGVLALERGLIPPNLNFTTPNPSIPLDEWNMVVPTKLTAWPAAAVKRMSVSGFGMGGTNAHIVMEGFKQSAAIRNPNGITISTKKISKRLFVFSSHDKAGFRRISQAILAFLDTLGPATSSSGYLANLAHTLAVARSGLSWKTSIVAENTADLREQLSTMVGDDATRSPTKAPRIGFVFTGQGAQWARMGVELLERHVFAESVAKSTQFLREMGANWDPIAELIKEQKESRLGLPQISQPICTVLQIALVEELRSCGIKPSKVVGHSSGEIAAAYTIGALSHRDAIAIAYFRGTASAGLSAKQLDGGMMAVGCSRAEAQKLMKNSKIQATVACVNSPSNVTLSGDVVALEALRIIFDGLGIFARRLKVDVAYHSSHMHLCSAEYYASITDIEHYQEDSAQENQIVMVSSVTGTEIDHELLLPYYWIRNLVSPVLFTDAVKELVSPGDGDGEKELDLLLEVGPHSALGGPIEQILSSHGIENVHYKSVLVRGKNALNTVLTLADELFRQGVAVNISKANGDTNCRLLADLPPYSWNHTESFRADSRLQREVVTQQFPTQSLLGAMMPTLEENERIWRSFIRLNDEPWLRSHVVGTTVLFPGAGMISIVLEAAQQIKEINKSALAYKLRDISFLAGLVLTEDVATEITVHLRPHLMATSGSTQPVWWEFTVSSCSGPTGKLRNNCRGLLSIIYEETSSPQMLEEESKVEANRIAKYQSTLIELPQTCTKKFFYERFAKSALPYGEVFQGVENCRPGPGKTCYDVKLIDIGETFSKGKLARPFLISPATLDAVLQGWLGSTCYDSADKENNGNFGFGKPMVPTSIRGLEISVNISADAGHTMPSVCTSHPHGFNEYSANIDIFDENLSQVLLSVNDFRLSPLEIDDGDEASKEEGLSNVDAAAISSQVRWDYALDGLDADGMKQIVLEDETVNIEEKATRFLQIVLHQRPALNIVEVVRKLGDASNTIISRLPSGSILTSQARYAVVDDFGDDFSNNDDNGLRSFKLDASVSVSETDSSVNLFIFSCNAENGLLGDIDSIVKRLVTLATPDAAFIIATSASIPNTDIKEPPSLPALNSKGFNLVASISDDVGQLFYYRSNNNIQDLPKKLTNGTHPQEVHILEPIFVSHQSEIVSKELRDNLVDQGFVVTTSKGLGTIKTNVNDVNKQIYIALLELESPVLEDLSESEFQNIKKLFLSSERLLWITRGDNPSFGIVDGVARCVNNEIASTRFQVLHLSKEGINHGPRLAIRVLKHLEATADNEFRERNGCLQVQRIYKGHNEDEHIRNHLEDSTRVSSINDANALFSLTIGKPGLLDTLHFIREENYLDLPLAKTEIEVEVKATGLNFRDIMASMGLVPVTGLGQEACGIVLRAGTLAAESFKIGDRVSTLSIGGVHATKAICDFRVTAKIPEKLSFEEGAASSMAHITAYYALVKLARLRRGQSVLIHAAAGGVGQAAVQLAKHLGLVVYVTVGSEDKRRFMTEHFGIVPEHIFNSRDSSFAKGIHRVTAGRGVDCVLNSLSGELLRISWNCLATFGTFVEIGLRDITDNMRLDMRPFSKSATFTYLDIPTLIKEDPTAIGEALAEVFKLLQKDILQVPSPLTTYPVGKVEDAFRIMQQGKHRGKIVLTFQEEDKKNARVLCKAKDSLKLDPTGTYLFVGGLGGLGRSLAKEFVASGARNIALISRSGTSKAESKAVVDELIALGVQVKVFRADIANQSSFLSAMEDCSQQLPPVKGVIQMAMILRDGVIENMTYEDWTIPLRTKVQGTWNLHQYFNHDRPLDFMIFCSSISGICGNPGQAQYDAGNSYQDALAHYRHSQGLKAVSVNLGIMLDVGVIAESVTHNFKTWEQVLGIREPTFHALMKTIINSQQNSQGGDWSPQICVGLGTANIMAANNLPNPPWLEDPRFGPLAVSDKTLSSSADSEGSTTISLASKLSDAGNNKDLSLAANIITVALVAKIAEILRIPSSEVDPSRPMYQYGVDSLVALEVRNWITRELKANMALLDIVAATPMETFAAQISQKSKLVMGVS